MDRKLNSLCIALAERDADTRHHCERVVGISLELGRHIALTDSELGLLELAALHHDIGKIAIPDAILRKPGRFEPAERETMRQHTLIGERIVQAIDDARAPELASLVRHHHESFDGSGYPDGLAGTHIPLLARILALADNYDALAESRPYHRGRPHREIIDLISGEDAEKFDPDLLHAFRHVIEHSPMRAD